MSGRVRHDDFLRRLASGDLLPSSDEARRHLRDCADCRERWRGLSRLAEELDAADAERREVLAGSAEPSDADVERAWRAAAAAGFARAPAAAPVTRRARTSSPLQTALGFTAVAAALVLAVFAFRAWFERPAADGPGQTLGSDERRVAGADGVLDADGVTIEYALGAGCSFRIEVEGWTPERERVTETHHVWDARWRPSAELLAKLAGRVVIRVQPLDVNGKEDGTSFECELALSR